jgi:solute carrier family 25 protein 44
VLPPVQADDAALDDLDLPKLLLVGSGFYSALNCCTYPLAVVKTRMQAAITPMSTMEAARELNRTVGLRGFYAGLLPTLFGALPARCGYITALESVRPVANTACETLGMGSTSAAALSNGCAGFAAVLASQTIYTPFDVVTQRVMVANGSSSGANAADASAVHVVREILATSGWRGLYRGFGVTLVAYLPGGSVWWSAYGGARAAVADHPSVVQQLHPVIEQATAATWASFWTVGVTSPLDVVKTRVQLSAATVAPSILATTRALISTEGLSGLYRGFLPRWCQASIFSGSVIALYEHLKIICRKDRTSP